MRCSAGRFWAYNGVNWEVMPNDLVKKGIIDCAREIIAVYELNQSASSLTNAAINILEGEAFKKGDPFGLTNENIPSVINCLDGFRGSVLNSNSV